MTLTTGQNAVPSAESSIGIGAIKLFFVADVKKNKLDRLSQLSLLKPYLLL
jgi:hypothetical protein